VVSVRIKNLTKRYNDVTAVDSVSLEIEKGELFFLLGPSGCGKTTILRSVAGFCEQDEGEIFFDDRRIDPLPPHERNTGMVFQNYALWPHMTVRQNVQYGLDVRGLASAEKKRRVDEALAMVHMSDQAAKRPNQLSGGQQQRVALARALVINPDVVLLDEPLSNLDAKLRGEMRDEIRRIHDETAITTIYVTHDQKEALSLADRVAVMSVGRVEQIGSPREIYDCPANRFVAEFIGETNLIPGKITSSDPNAVRVATELGDLLSSRSCDLAVGDEVFCSIRPEATRIVGDASVANAFPAKIASHTYLGEANQFVFDAGGVSLRAMSLGESDDTSRGSQVRVGVEPDDIVVLSRS